MVQRKDIERRISELQEQIIEVLKKSVELESPTADRGRVHAVGEWFSELFSEFLTDKKEYGDEYKVFLMKKGRGKSIFISHVDTVHPVGALKKNPFRQENGKIFGPGVLDMKGGIVAFYFALRLAKEFGEIPEISFLMNTEEETGSRHTRDYMKRIASQHKYCFSLEPSGAEGKLKTSRKGVISLRLETRGRMAHAGLAPEKGINAIDELIDQLAELREWISVREGSFNIGVIRGGDRPNVVPGSAYALVDVRFEEDGFSEKLREYMGGVSPIRKGALVELTFESYVPPLVPTLPQRKLYSRMKRFFSEVGIELEETHSSGGSDASWFSKWGLAAIDGLGPEGEGAHSENEHLYFNSLKQRIILLTYLILNLKELAP